MILEFLFALALVAVAPILRPAHVHCPVGWLVNGVPRSGVTLCRLPPLEVADCSGSRRCFETYPDRAQLPLRVFCPPATVPVVGHGQTISCRKPPHAHPDQRLE